VYLAVVAAFAPIFGLGLAQGGYFPASWGWASFPLLWAAAIACAVRGRIELRRLDAAFAVALVVLVAWIALSAAWSTAPAETVREVERALVYLAAALALLFVARAGATTHLLGAALAATTVVAGVGLATRLVPDRVGVYDQSGVYRLSEPIGYWNGLGIFAALGVILGVGFAARGRSIAGRAVAGAIVVPLVLTLYFTFGRAAWIALGVGVALALVVDPRLLQLLVTVAVLAPASAIAVLTASREPGLTHAGEPLALAARDGHRVAAFAAACAVAAAAATVLLALCERKLNVSDRFQRRATIALATAVVVALAVALGLNGGPAHVVRKAYDSFEAPLPHVGANLNHRLLSFSGHGRPDLWRIAWADARHHPLLGAGAGTYERYFLTHQPPGFGRVRDAHSLYLETLAELGPIGLALLLAWLVVPFIAVRSARGHPLVPAAFGAYCAYLVHAGVDWDWELPAVTLVAIVCATALLLARRGEGAALAAPVRIGAAAALVAAAVFAGIAVIGEAALSRSAGDRARGDAAAAATAARRASSLLPWSPVPWDALGRAQLEAGRAADARASFRKALSLDGGDWQLWYDLASSSDGRERATALRHVASLFPRYRENGVTP